MEIIAIESQTFQQMQAMYAQVCKVAQNALAENKALKSDRYLTAKETAKMLKIHTNTLIKIQDQIGYRQISGKDKRFPIENIEAYMKKDFIYSK